MKLTVQRDKNIADSWLHETVFRQRSELWATVGYIMLCVEIDLKNG